MYLPTQGRMTRTDFHRLVTSAENQDQALELFDGTICRRKVSPGRTYAAAVACAVVGRYVEERALGCVFSRLGIEIPGEPYFMFAPDVSFVSYERGAVFGWDMPLLYMPDLVVEIQSPEQSDKLMRDKGDYYLKHGCRQAVLVYAKRIVEVLTPDDRHLLTVDDTLSGGDVLPGFAVEVAKLFAG
ncbi:MAG: Uma2 family endonuclease [Anaerolineae bacterium]|nr:Uma2 family endonuclease [Anaerolineae bacterium]